MQIKGQRCGAKQCCEENDWGKTNKHVSIHHFCRNCCDHRDFPKANFHFRNLPCCHVAAPLVLAEAVQSFETTQQSAAWPHVYFSGTMSQNH